MDQAPQRSYRYYDFCLAGMVVVLLCSNLIGPGKVCAVQLPLYGLLVFGAGNLFFPVSYIFDDVMTEVYGYARAPRHLGRVLRHGVRHLHVVGHHQHAGRSE